MGFGDVEHFHESVVAAYDDAGYDLIEVPRGSVEERAAFVREQVLH